MYSKRIRVLDVSGHLNIFIKCKNIKYEVETILYYVRLGERKRK